MVSINTSIFHGIRGLARQQIARVISNPSNQSILVVSQSAEAKLSALTSLGSRYNSEIGANGLTRQFGKVTVFVDMLLPNPANILRLNLPMGPPRIKLPSKPLDEQIIDCLVQPECTVNLAAKGSVPELQLVHQGSLVSTPVAHWIADADIVGVLDPDTLLDHFGSNDNISYRMVIGALIAGKAFPLRGDWELVVGKTRLVSLPAFHHRQERLARTHELGLAFHAHTHPFHRTIMEHWSTIERSKRDRLIEDQCRPSPMDRQAYESTGVLWASIHAAHPNHQGARIDNFFMPGAAAHDAKFNRGSDVPKELWDKTLSLTSLIEPHF